MIMFAGLGTRMRPFTGALPKPLLPVMGVPCAQFCLDALAAGGATRAVANIHHLPEAARAGIAALDTGGISIGISDESALLLGSAGGIRHALPALGNDPFFILNADVLCLPDLGALAQRHHELREKHGVTLTLGLLPSGTANYREIHVDVHSGLVTGTGSLQRGKPYYSGVAVIEPAAVSHLADGAVIDFVQGVLLPAIRSKKAGFFMMNCPWLDIGTPKTWLEAHLSLIALLDAGTAPVAWTNRIEKHSLGIAAGVWTSRTVSIKTNNIWTGPCFWSPWNEKNSNPPKKIGPRAAVYGPIPRGTALSDCVIFGGFSASGL
ncbi:MAG: hypothetical protein A2583_02030 [Bdellovibrionales bacterium RIFOXYD1_FULL_53_11]|nr:MAG: hypothetical protein A2583_02030 [Bdellovibrionales bacterium RIFOXYD1_FULL_53_11]